ncbi:putative protein phosphatase 2C 55 [Morus notabilis]|uniref:Protein phosphatase n=1 Tax=Morus notabilis TaxID=981085 RepID=W9QWB4_9ROSA|nr:probable protein phosphatase 2C 55 [Morus notabilis]EXB22347.1 putative protein phosphatase 2C 55 [Morus notabilis]
MTDLQSVLETQMMKLQLAEAAELEDGKSQKQCFKSLLKKSERPLKMVSAAYYIPKDQKLKPQGEDAHFICADEQVIGTADGVGGWVRQGIDAGEYALKLMINSADTVRKIKASSSSSAIDPKKVLYQAFVGARKIKGSSTACIVALNGRVLHAANVGDSGFIVFRDKQFLYRSPTQQRGFNRPYQLGNHWSSDRPHCASEPKVPVMVGDIVVLGTDGLLDNLFIREMEIIIEKTEEVKPEKLAEEIARMAYFKSLNEDCETPFSSTMCKFLGRQKLGGKKDDITVIVGHIVGK